MYVKRKGVLPPKGERKRVEKTFVAANGSEEKGKAVLVRRQSWRKESPKKRDEWVVGTESQTIAL